MYFIYKRGDFFMEKNIFLINIFRFIGFSLCFFNDFLNCSDDDTNKNKMNKKVKTSIEKINKEKIKQKDENIYKALKLFELNENSTWEDVKKAYNDFFEIEFSKESFKILNPKEVHAAFLLLKEHQKDLPFNKFIQIEQEKNIYNDLSQSEKIKLQRYINDILPKKKNINPVVKTRAKNLQPGDIVFEHESTEEENIGNSIDEDLANEKLLKEEKSDAMKVKFPLRINPDIAQKKSLLQEFEELKAKSEARESASKSEDEKLREELSENLGKKSLEELDVQPTSSLQEIRESYSDMQFSHPNRKRLDMAMSILEELHKQRKLGPNTSKRIMYEEK